MCLDTEKPFSSPYTVLTFLPTRPIPLKFSANLTVPLLAHRRCRRRRLRTANTLTPAHKLIQLPTRSRLTSSPLCRSPPMLIPRPDSLSFRIPRQGLTYMTPALRPGGNEKLFLPLCHRIPSPPARRPPLVICQRWCRIILRAIQSRPVPLPATAPSFLRPLIHQGY